MPTTSAAVPVTLGIQDVVSHFLGDGSSQVCKELVVVHDRENFSSVRLGRFGCEKKETFSLEQFREYAAENGISSDADKLLFEIASKMLSPEATLGPQAGVFYQGIWLMLNQIGNVSVRIRRRSLLQLLYGSLSWGRSFQEACEVLHGEKIEEQYVRKLSDFFDLPLANELLSDDDEEMFWSSFDQAKSGARAEEWRQYLV